jgi:two-component system CheB/CheR fusion protein
MLGISAAENASKSRPDAEQLPFRVLHDGAEVPPEELPMQRAARLGTVIADEEYDIVRGDGTTLRLLEYATPLHDEGGRVRGSVAAFVDITARRRAEEELEEANRRKDEFLATLAHELRNPLAPIRNAVQILHLKGPLDRELQWARAVIERQVQLLARLVDDLLDVSRITRGKIELRKERVTLSEVIERALETSRPLLQASDQALTVSLPDEPLRLDVDPTRLSQVLANLLNNAAKYTKAGGHVEVSAAREGRAVVIRVRDDGIGIPRTMLSRIFDMFAQVDTSLVRAQGGLGIGLTIAKRLLEMHGGSIEAESPGPGQGSTFTVRLPLAADEEAERASRAEQSRERTMKTRLRILVVDDNQDATDTLAMMLELLQYEVRAANDGAEALEIAAQFCPEVVLLDIGMPIMSGYEVAERLRQADTSKGAVLVAMTGWGQEEDLRRSREAGFDHHLVKPVDPARLTALLEQISEARKG